MFPKVLLSTPEAWRFYFSGGFFMDKKKKELLDQLEAKTNEANTLFTKEAPTEDEIKSARQLTADALTIKAQIDDLEQDEERVAALKSINAFIKKPANQLPQPGEARVTDFKAAGFSTIVQEKENSVLYQDGEGLLNDKQMKTVQDPGYAAAMKAYIRAKGDFGRMGAVEVKAIQEGIDEDGGFLAPAEMLAKLIERKPTPTRIAGNVTNLTSSRDAIVLPKANYNADDIYTSGIRVTWTGEPGNPPPATSPTFGQFRVPIYTAMLELNLTNDMIEDSVFPIQSYVAGKFAETVDILKDDMILNGNSISQPTGILPFIDTANGVTSLPSGGASTITADALVSMAYDIPEQYMENSKWVFNRTNTEKAIALLQDSQKRYLFSTGSVDASIATARPNALLAFPIVRSGLMPNVIANAYPVLFGDLSAYYQILRVGFTIQILKEVEARSNQIVLLGRMRFGGNVAEPWRLRAMKVAAS
jgi:HK97 family phage major capsid protein